MLGPSNYLFIPRLGLCPFASVSFLRGGDGVEWGEGGGGQMVSGFCVVLGSLNYLPIRLRLGCFACYALFLQMGIAI